MGGLALECPAVWPHTRGHWYLPEALELVCKTYTCGQMDPRASELHYPHGPLKFWTIVSYCHHCDKIPERNQVKGGKGYLGSWVQSSGSNALGWRQGRVSCGISLWSDMHHCILRWFNRVFSCSMGHLFQGPPPRSFISPISQPTPWPLYTPAPGRTDTFAPHLRSRRAEVRWEPNSQFSLCVGYWVG